MFTLHARALAKEVTEDQTRKEIWERGVGGGHLDAVREQYPDLFGNCAAQERLGFADVLVVRQDEYINHFLRVLKEVLAENFVIQYCHEHTLAW